MPQLTTTSVQELSVVVKSTPGVMSQVYHLLKGMDLPVISMEAKASDGGPLGLPADGMVTAMVEANEEQIEIAKARLRLVNGGSLLSPFKCPVDPLWNVELVLSGKTTESWAAALDEAEPMNLSYVMYVCPSDTRRGGRRWGARIELNTHAEWEILSLVARLRKHGDMHVTVSQGPVMLPSGDARHEPADARSAIPVPLRSAREEIIAARIREIGEFQFREEAEGGQSVAGC